MTSKAIISQFGIKAILKNLCTSTLPMAWIRLLFLMIMLSGFCNANAQPLQLSFHHLTEENGLTQASKYFISKDSKGFVWIGSEDGLLRFDGFQIIKHQNEADNPSSLLENVITSKCFEDPNGNLWFTSSKAVNCYRRKQNDFISFSYSEQSENYHAFYLDPNDKLWLRIGLGNEGALYSFDITTASFEQHLPLQGAEATAIVDEEGEMVQVISTSLSKRPGLVWTDLKTRDTKSIEFQYTSEGKKLPFSSPTRSIFVDSEHIAWVGIYNGIGKYKVGSSEGVIERKRRGGIDTDIGLVSDIVEYNADYLLVSAYNGLLLFDKNTQSFIHQFRYKNDDSYSLNLKAPNNLFLDRDSTLWISGSHQEIAFSHLFKKRFSHLEETSGSFISTMAEDHLGNIWCGTLDSGIHVFNQQKELLFQSYQLKNPTSPKGYTDLKPLDFFVGSQQEQWWANVQNTYLRWNEASRIFEFDMAYFLGVGGMSSAQINYNYRLSNGKNLIAKGAEIFELRLTKEKVDTVFWHNINYLQVQTINIIFEDQNKHIYLGDDQGRLLILKEENKQLKKVADLEDVGIITAFQADLKRNTVWLASSKGLGKVDSKTYGFHFLNKKEDRLPNEALYGIALDQSGQLWLPGNTGLIRYHPDTKAFHRFGTADGLRSPVFNKNACITASQTGEIWLGGKNGVNVFKPEDIKLLNAQPNIQLSRLLVNDEIYKPEENLNEQEKLSFNYDQNTLSFEFVALDYSDPSANKFRCQMLGYDKEPIEQGTRNFIRYGNLPAGDYRFKVWGSNSDGVFNKAPLEMGITIIPPFYQTWWFYLLCTVVLLGVTYGVFKYRLEQALKMERLRVKISSDLHDDVGGLLSGLAMQTELLERTADERTKSKLKRIGELSRSAMSRMRDTVWAIDARKDKLEDLVDRMNEHAEETLTPKDFSYKVKVENLDLSTNIPTDIRQNLYLIFKESITNTAKHSNGDHVNAILKKQDGEFVMRIVDNGKVIAKNYKTTGQGLSNIAMRAKQIDADISTSIKEGYEIILRRKSF